MDTQKTLRAIRIDLGLSTNAMAIACGVTRDAITNAEAGRRIRPSTAKKIADFLSAQLDENIQPSDINGLNIG